MEIAAQACERTRIECGRLSFAEQCNYCERESVNVSLSNLLTFPFIKQEIARKALELHGWCAGRSGKNRSPRGLIRLLKSAGTAGRDVAGLTHCPLGAQVLRPGVGDDGHVAAQARRHPYYCLAGVFLKTGPCAWCGA